MQAQSEYESPKSDAGGGMGRSPGNYKMCGGRVYGVKAIDQDQLVRALRAAQELH